MHLQFDLNTQEQVGYFSLWYDVLASRPGLVAPANLTFVAEKLRARIALFCSQFDTGDWRLWNGNNWTPRLSVGALQWVIAFWHEQKSIAREVLRMVNDLLWSARAPHAQLPMPMAPYQLPNTVHASSPIRVA